MDLKNKNTNKIVASQSNTLSGMYIHARCDLLFIGIMTVINILLLLTNTDTYFLFSATVPYLIVYIGMIACGRFPAEFYTDGWEGFAILPPMCIGFFLLFAFAITALYVLSYFLSKKDKVGWLIFALVFFAIDTIIMFVFQTIDGSMIIDFALRIYVLVSFVMGIISQYRLKKLPPVENPSTDEPNICEDLFNTNEVLISSQPLREADLNVKQRIFIQTQVFGHEIIYRRVKRVNELIIDNKVYDEYIALIEKAHMLTANFDGHSYAVGVEQFTGITYLMIDGKVAVQKRRLI